MRKQLSYILTCYLFSLSLSGCSEDLAAPEAEGELVPITFTASNVGVSVEQGTQTRAATPFLNNKVAIIAAKSSSEDKPTDWSDGNLHINHAEAIVGTFANDKYSINFNPTKYWPFHNNEEGYNLGFVAYSPIEDAALSHTQDAPTKLNIAVTTSISFPDLLYTKPTDKSYNKVTGKDGVSLGEFNHAMAQLVIEVIPIDKTTLKEITNYSNDKLKITNLNIQTQVITGIFDLQTSTWELTNPTSSTDTKVKTLIDNSNAKALPYRSNNKQQGGSSTTEYYLFPATGSVNTVNLSQIELTMKDGIVADIGDTYTLDKFTFDKNGTSTPITLEMGKITTLTIKVKVTEIETGGSNNTILEGTLKDWIYKGNSSITIE